MDSPELEKRNGLSPLATVFLTVFIDLLGFGIVIPLLPIYSKMFGATELELGLLFASFSAMQFFFAPMWGRISDRIGRRPVLIGGLFGTAASYVLFGFSNSLPWLFLSRCLAGFFGANISTASAYIADVTTQENRSKGMGLIGAAFGLGFTIGPLLGGVLSKYSLGLPGYVAAGLSLCAACFGYFNLREPETKRIESSRVFGVDTIQEVAKNKRISTLFLLSYLAIFSWSAFEAMFILFGLAKFPTVFGLQQAIEKATADQVIHAAPIAGYYLFGIGIISAIIQGLLIRRLVPKFGETKLIIAGPIILSISFFVVGFAPVWGMVIVGCLLMPLGFGVNNPSLIGLISRASPQHHQGSYLGLSQSVASFARMTGPPAAGLLFHLFNPETPFFVGAGILLFSAFLAIRYRKQYASSFANAPSSESLQSV